MPAPRPRRSAAVAGREVATDDALQCVAAARAHRCAVPLNPCRSIRAPPNHNQPSRRLRCGMRLARFPRMLVRLGARLERLDARRDVATAYLAMTAVLSVAAAVFMFRLGAAELCSTNEAVEGLAVQQMVEHGALLSPV